MTRLWLGMRTKALSGPFRSTCLVRPASEPGVVRLVDLWDGSIWSVRFARLARLLGWFPSLMYGSPYRGQISF